MALVTTAKRTKWNRSEIAKEIKRLDSITGLKGSLITIKMYEDREPLGYFSFIDPVRMTFGFSSTRFEEPGFTDAEALDIIRHEYAHFMEYKLFGESTDHGKNWKKCCIHIGANPEKLYTKAGMEEARKKTKELARKTRTDGFAVGKYIKHPVFGLGRVEAIEKKELITKLTIAFKDRTRTMDIDWVRKNCRIINRDEALSGGKGKI